jgi:hypothetical protein
MDSLTIQSSDSDARLTLYDPFPRRNKEPVEGFKAKLESHRIPTSESEVFGAGAPYFHAFFITILKGERPDSDYCSVEDHLEIQASKSDEKFVFRVILRDGPWEDYWEVDEIISLSGNELHEVVEQLRAFLRIHSAI